jgi:cellulose synthase/poly-beta-1,6-N-acetylglucosamine synthase-like glycosyltransferase
MLAYSVRHYIFTLVVLRKKPSSSNINPAFEPTVTILIPAHNEEQVVGRLLKRISEFTYPQNKMQVIIIDDGSIDATGKIADQFCQNYPFIQVVHRSGQCGGRGKSRAMNDGFKLATGEIVLCFDADYYPQKDIIENLTSAFIDPKVGAVQGRVVVLNEPQNIVTRLIAIERIGGYRVDQQARDDLGLITQFGGTVGGFRRSLLENLGGWDTSILAEDTDLTFRVCLAGYKIRYNVNAECYEEAVDNWGAYRKQRFRWAKGHMQCFFKHFLNVLTSKKLTVKEKIDGLLLLNIYFMPILVLFSLVIGITLIWLGSPFSILWLGIPLFLFSFVGNFAPFFEVGIGLYLDGRTRTQWLTSLLIFNFIYNIPICTFALLSLVVSKLLRRDNRWSKTVHQGNGNRYIAT